MARAQTIKSFVEALVLEGEHPEEIWREAQKRFPHKCVSWSYVTKIRKQCLEARAAVTAGKGTEP